MKYAIQILTKYDDGTGYRECQTIEPISVDMRNHYESEVGHFREGILLGLSIGGEANNYKVNIILVEGDSK